MQAEAEAAQEAEEGKEEGLVLLRRIHELEGELALRARNISFGYVRGRNMLKLGNKIDISKPRVEAIDIPPVEAQMPDD